jgi:hypothetical protein
VRTIVIAPTSWTIMLAETESVSRPNGTVCSPSETRNGGVVWPAYAGAARRAPRSAGVAGSTVRARFEIDLGADVEREEPDEPADHAESRCPGTHGRSTRAPMPRSDPATRWSSYDVHAHGQRVARNGSNGTVPAETGLNA